MLSQKVLVYSASVCPKSDINTNKTPAQAFTLASEWGDTCYGVIDMGVGDKSFSTETT